MTNEQRNENARTFAARIKKAETLDELRRLEASLDRIWNAGDLLTASQFMRLDGAIMDRLVAIEHA